MKRKIYSTPATYVIDVCEAQALLTGSTLSEEGSKVVPDEQHDPSGAGSRESLWDTTDDEGL